MRRSQSIGFRLSAAFAVLFAILFGFGLVGLGRLEEFNRELASIRDRWLKSTRYLGDLNNYTSDFRAMEATSLLTPSGQTPQDAATLDAAIARAQHGYESVPHDETEIALYQRFETIWKTYRSEAKHAFDLSAAGRSEDAVAVYLSSSQGAFAEASDLLERLNDRNNRRAQWASERAAAAIESAGSYTGAAVTLALITVLVILFYVARTVVFPLRKLAHGMNLLSAGEMDVDIPGADQADELGEMARAVTVFRANAIELKVGQRGLASQATMLEEKLAHERRLNQQQRNFITMASHEFRTPMTIIDGHAQRLLNAQDPGAAAKVAERAKKIRAAVKRMTAMIDNILRTSNFFDEKPNLYLHKCEFDMRALLHEVCKLHREISPNAVIVEDLGAQPLKIWGDKDLLYQTFNNLVANSVKYSPAGGAIKVSATLRGDGVRVSVADEGIGIPRSDIPHLFERYYRGRNVASIVGTGIGLFFVKIVVDLHDGSIAVESEQDRGATFEVALPRSAPSEAAAKAS